MWPICTTKLGNKYSLKPIIQMGGEKTFTVTRAISYQHLCGEKQRKATMQLMD